MKSKYRIFVDTEEKSGFKLWDPIHIKVTRSRNVGFNKNVMVVLFIMRQQ